MVTQPVNAPARQRAAFRSLARRIASPRPVALSTLARREAEAYRHCERLQDTLALIDVQTDGEAWSAVYAVLREAYALHAQAVARHTEAWEETQAERYEAEQLGAALMAERLVEYEMSAD